MMASLLARCRQWRASSWRFDTEDGFFFASLAAFGAALTASAFGAGAWPHAGHASVRAASRIIFFMSVPFCFAQPRKNSPISLQAPLVHADALCISAQIASPDARF